METRCFIFLFPNYSKKLLAKGTLVPPLWHKQEKHVDLIFIVFVRAAARGAICVLTLKIVSTLITNRSRDDTPSIST